MLKPFIKWPGNKRGEIGQILPLIPDYDRYIEPFVGGGALYLALNPAKAVINDTSEYLMELYELVKEQDKELHRILDLYSRTFSALKRSCADHFQQLLFLYRMYEAAAKEGEDITLLKPHQYVTEKIVMDAGVVSELIVDMEEYKKTMLECVEDRLIRMAAGSAENAYTSAQLREGILTGFTTGYFMYLRSIYNDIAAKRIITTKQYRIANFYFIREYCFTSRYNRKGEFNLSYGGATYNSKDLTDKINIMFSPEMGKLMKRTTVSCEDFEVLLEKLELTERDFLFLDPPDDMDVLDNSEYSFSREDQYRLAQFLEGTTAKFVLMIKNTEFSYNLYDGKFRIIPVENRAAGGDKIDPEYLIVTNTPEDLVPWFWENI